jgi:large subunit ribosomal protein L15e
MGIYKYVKKLWTKPKKEMRELYKARLIQWRKEGAIERIAKPTRIDRARTLGYKAIQGVIVARVRVEKKRRMRQKRAGGRRSRTFRRYEVINLNHQRIAEQRANKRFVNCEVLNSYFVAIDGIYKWYEVILIDRTHPAIVKNKQYKNIVKQKGRVYRGLTSAGKKSRGLRKKGVGAEKVRPSVNANKGRLH